MAIQDFPIDAVLDTCRRLQFGMADVIRRAQGHAFGAFGLGPSECPYQVIASDAFWRLRDYGQHATAPSLLIVAAPIKRPYIWDLAPAASAIRYILGRGLHVHLLEWLPASQATGKNGLTEYTKATLATTLHRRRNPFSVLCCLVHRCAFGPQPAVFATR
jgi:poly[(R)-3-hydroxyalkanoate] polymerase subunit PhaC